MKKSIIAAGAASVALAAMPIVGVFAAPVNTQDNINATISDGCTVTDPALSKTVNMSVAPGNVATSTAAPSISVTCNKTGWHITAVGSSNTYEQSGYLVTDLVAQNGTDPDYTYARIPTGTNTTTASNWAFKVAELSDPAGAEIASGYNVFTAIPDQETNIVNGTAAATETVYIQYQVFATVGQTAGQYKGQVTYSVTDQEV